MWKFPKWAFPTISSCVWLGMLTAMLIVWNVEGRPHYDSMGPAQTVPFVSDIGAETLKPLFITGSTITAILLDCAFACERWLRHQSRHAKTTAATDKALGALTIVFAVVGTVGLIMLGIFDTLRYPQAHKIFVLLFIFGYIVSAIFMCWEFHRLEIHYRGNKILRVSYWVKFIFIFVETALVVAFIVCDIAGSLNPSAVLEWTVAFVFTFYIFSYLIDLLPFIHRKHDFESEIAIVADAA